MEPLSGKPASEKSSGRTAEVSQDEEEAHFEKTDESSGHGSPDEFTVFWDEPIDQDPENPLNWTTARKASIIAAISFITFLTPLASSMFAPGVPDVMADFSSSSKTLSTFVVSIFVLGFAFGK